MISKKFKNEITKNVEQPSKIDRARLAWVSLAYDQINPKNSCLSYATMCSNTLQARDGGQGEAYEMIDQGLTQITSELALAA